MSRYITCGCDWIMFEPSFFCFRPFNVSFSFHILPSPDYGDIQLLNLTAAVPSIWKPGILTFLFHQPLRWYPSSSNCLNLSEFRFFLPGISEISIICVFQSLFSLHVAPYLAYVFFAWHLVPPRYAGISCLLYGLSVMETLMRSPPLDIPSLTF